MKELPVRLPGLKDTTISNRISDSCQTAKWSCSWPMHTPRTKQPCITPLAPRSISSHVVLFRSKDNGKTWSVGRHVPELIGGHEPSVSVINGNLYVKTTIHGSGAFPDPYAERDYSYSVIARSEDSGNTFTKTYIDNDFSGAAYGQRIQDSRNIIELADGRLFFGIGVGNSHVSMYSDDNGGSWYKRRSQIDGCRYVNMDRSFYTEAVFFYTDSGRLMMLTRVDYDYTEFADPLPHDPHYTGGTRLDNFDGEVLFESCDDGLSWQPLRAVGFPSLMYPSIVNLKDNRMLLTYTVREIPPANTGCLYPKVGVQAIVAEEKADGFMDFDFSRDVIIIDDSTPDSMRNAGCFGNTIVLPDSMFITPFSYPLIDDEILELADNKEYMKQEVFDHYALMQNTYEYRYKDFVNDDPALMELHLRRNFSALFLYGHCTNKGGIATAAVRWRL